MPPALEARVALRTGIGLLLACALGSTSPAFADESASAKAQALDAKARALKERGDVRGALPLYEAALELEPSPVRVCDVGAAYYHLNELAPAHFFFAQCLRFSGHVSAKKRQQITQGFAYLDGELRKGNFTQVEFTAAPDNAEIHLPGLSTAARFEAPAMVWLPHGEHSFEATAEGYASQRGTAKAHGTTTSIHLALAPLAKPAEPKVPVQTAESGPSANGVPAPVMATAPATDARPKARSKSLAWISVASGAGLVAVGGIFHLRAVGIRSDLETLPSGEDRRSSITDLKRERLIMAGFYGVGAAALGVGTFLMFREHEKKSESPHLVVGPTSVGIRGSF